MNVQAEQTALLAWEQQPGESAKAYAAFVVYRDMGSSRSLDKVARHFGKTSRNYQKMSQLYSWVERVRAWDTHLRQEQDEQEKQERLGARKRRRQYLNALESELVTALKGIREAREQDAKSNKTVVDLDALRGISSLARAVMSESRQEFNDLPTTKHEIEYTMPPELRQLLQARGLKASDVFEAMLQEMATQEPK